MEEIRRLGETLRHVRRQEPSPEASPMLRQAVQDRLEDSPAAEDAAGETDDVAETADASESPTPEAPAARGPNLAARRRLWIALSLAASLLLAVGLTLKFTPAGQRIVASWTGSATPTPLNDAERSDEELARMKDLDNETQLGTAAVHDRERVESTVAPREPASGLVVNDSLSTPSSSTPSSPGDDGGRTILRAYGDVARSGQSPARTPAETSFEAFGRPNAGGGEQGQQLGSSRPGGGLAPPVASPEPPEEQKLMEQKRLSSFDVETGESRRELNRALAESAKKDVDGVSAAERPQDTTHRETESLGETLADEKTADKKQLEDKLRKARARTWRRAQATPNASRLLIGEQEELPLRGMQANVQVDGFRARVLLDLYFYNDRDRQFEGAFSIRLPNEASLYFFAFGETVYQQPNLSDQLAFFSVERSRELRNDPKSVMLARTETWKDAKEARIVQREKAAHAYRETVRRRVDPALVEWAGAGVFQARVFPLAPKKLSRVVIGYDVNLLEVGDDLLYRLDVPGNSPQTVVDLSVAAQDREQLEVTPAARPTDSGQRRHYRFTNPEQPGVAVRFPGAGASLLYGQGDQSGPYFAARFQPQLPAAASIDEPRDGVFLVDTSLSANPDRFNIYLKLLRASLENNRGLMRRFAVQFFNVESHWWRAEWTDNTPASVDRLMEYAGTLALEGATDLLQAGERATQTKWLGDRDYDFFLLSDAAWTWGDRDPQRLADVFKTRRGAVFAYATGLSGDDTGLMRWLARETGGAAFAVTGEDQIAKVSTAHRSRPWRLVDVSLAGGDDLLLAGRPQTLFPGQTLLLVGRGTPDAGAKVTLRLQRGGEEKTVKTALPRRVRSDLAARLYGQVAVGDLEDLEAVSRDVAVAYARHFRVARQTCSLLMLETEADYQRFGIKPEEDAFVVNSSPARRLIEQALDESAKTRNDPRARFVDWLTRLRQTPGLNLRLSPTVNLVIDRLPPASFAASAKPLNCKLRLWSDLPAAFQDEQLSARPLAYDGFRAEAQRRLTAAGADDALRALSSLIEQSPGDGVLARDVGFSAIEWGRPDQAYPLLRRVALSRPYEPQTYHLLARCLAETGHVDLAMLYYEIAVSGQWDARFGEFTRIAGLDYLRFLRRIERGDLKSQAAQFAQARLKSLDSAYGIGQPDLVVTMSWNTDGTDVDMHLIEPGGEECYYEHRDTRLGGHLSTDVTQGYGPEMYVLRKAPPGEYKLQAHYFSTDANRASTRTRVYVSVYRDWGTPRERVTSKTVTLTSGKQTHDVATIVVKGS